MAKILIVEDDQLLRDAMCALLRAERHEVLETGDGKEAIQRFESFAPDLVVTDIIMPDVEGLETIQSMRLVSPGVKILAISGGGRVGPDQYLTIAVKLGAASALEKPFSGPEFLGEVRRLLAAPAPGVPLESSCGLEAHQGA